VIERLHLRHFKAFSDFSIRFGEQCVLVGPNSAGKSTVIAALRTAAHMMRLARSRAADGIAPRSHGSVRCYRFTASAVQLVVENLRHEFRERETQLAVRFNGGASLTAAWPIETDDDEGPEPFFIIRDSDQVVLSRPTEVKDRLPDVAVVPVLNPVEHEELVLEPRYVRSEASGRLASRHFRNHLYLLQLDDGWPRANLNFEEFLAWAEPWMPELTVNDLTLRQSPKGRLIDLFCREPDSRTERELFWLGDGMQVWLQLLAHIYRARNQETIILDEPDLYLHADLQRRLVRLLESLDCQSIAASHSAELLAEADPGAVRWISKDRRGAVQAPDERLLGALTDAIGSQFNLRLARTLRARGVLFVEGDDMLLLRHVAAALGLSELTRQTHVVTVPLGGFSNWEHVEPFRWLVQDMFGEAVRVLVILDRDYRTDRQCDAIKRRLHEAGVSCHVWARKELESYFLVPSVIARLSGAFPEAVARVIAEGAEQQRQAVFARQLAERTRLEVTGKQHAVTVTEAHQRDFERAWGDQADRPNLCDA
jgi:predicted ATP-dependent endonuclease of OLD family